MQNQEDAVFRKWQIVIAEILGPRAPSTEVLRSTYESSKKEVGEWMANLESQELREVSNG